MKTSDILINDLAGQKGAKEIEYKWELFKARFEYGWKYFDFHARQRTTMFNFFALFSGVIANAYVLLLREHLLIPSLFVALLGSIMAFVFIFIDRRNEELVHIAEDVLLSLEKDILFSDYKRFIKWPRRRGWLGNLIANNKKRQIGIFLREEADEKDIGKSKYSHGKWLPRMQILIAVFFMFCLAYSIYCLIAQNNNKLIFWCLMM